MKGVWYYKLHKQTGLTNTQRIASIISSVSGAEMFLIAECGTSVKVEYGLHVCRGNINCNDQDCIGGSA